MTNLCLCGHELPWHNHLRKGTDCSYSTRTGGQVVWACNCTVYRSESPLGRLARKVGGWVR